MQPSSNPAPVHPAPIMDVTPPPKSTTANAAQNTQALPTKANGLPAAAPQTEASNQAQQTSKQAIPKHTGPALPAVAIAFAVVFFAALTALAYYAYTKAK